MTAPTPAEAAADVARLLALIPAPYGPALAALAQAAPLAPLVVEALAHLHAGMDPAEVPAALGPDLHRAAADLL